MPEPEGTPAAPAPDAPPDEYAEPEALPEGVTSFDRDYVEKLRASEAKHRIAARDTHKQLEDIGGFDKAKAAVEWQESLQTEDGVVQMFVEAGRSLGLGVKELEALFDTPGGIAAVVDAAAGATPPGDDDVLTWKEARELLRKEVQEPAAQAAQRQQIAVAQSTIAAERLSLGLTDQKDYEDVLAFGQRYLPDGDFDPDHIKQAMRKGKADFDALAARKSAEYLNGKKEAKDTVPASSGGGGAPGGSGPGPEPANTEEAKARVRALMRGGA